jgi:dTDP-4-amino-4,6-dideoxygalactose transaminase
VADGPSITFAYPNREHEALREDLERAATRVLRSGSYVLGPDVQAFEQAFSEYTGAPHTIAVSSGTDALVCALIALGVGPGHDVIVPAFGFVAAAEAVVRVGATPVFVDVEPNTLGPDPQACRRVVCDRTRAVIVMHLFGQAVDLASLRDAIGELPIVEDAAQAIGTRVGHEAGGTAKQGLGGTAKQGLGGTAKQGLGGTAKQGLGGTAKQGLGGTAKQASEGLHASAWPCGCEVDESRPSGHLAASAVSLGRATQSQHAPRQVGTIERVGTFSFFPAKSFGAAGDAGAVTTADPELAQRVRRARAHGASRAYVWDGPGGNYRMDAIQAALLTVKLGALDARLLRRKQIGRRLSDVASAHDICVLSGGATCEPTYAPFVLRLAARGRDDQTARGRADYRRDDVLERLRARGVDARVHYPTTLCDAPVYRSLAGPGPWPEAHRATRELMSLPCSPELSDDEVERLVSALSEVLRG